MTKGELKFALAKWASNYGKDIIMDEWDNPDKTTETGAIIKIAKNELEKILTNANCEHIYEDSSKIFPTGADMAIELQPNYRFESYRWLSDNEIALKYKKTE